MKPCLFYCRRRPYDYLRHRRQLPRSHCRTLSASAKKTILSGWLPLPPTQSPSSGGSFLLAARIQSTLRLLTFSYSNSK